MLGSFVLAVTVLLSSFVSAAAAMALFGSIATHRGRKRVLADLDPDVVEQSVFLFEGTDLVDATRPARSLLSSLPGEESDWKKIAAYLSRHIDHFLAEMADLPQRGEIALGGRTDSGIGIRAEWLGGMTRLIVNDTNRGDAGILVDGLSLKAQAAEVEELRECLSQAPMLIWRTDASGLIVWANEAYLDKAMEREQLGEDDLTWPIPALFPAAAPHEDATRRLSLAARPHMGESWFDCHSYASGDGTLYYAIPANAAVRAERAQQDFRQTLARTFAHVPIGLAIFDRSRQLQLFNPALVDLISLDVEFLSSRPTLPGFLDRLREARIIPEPKDYGLWRQQMAELERAAACGQYEETWALPSGLTFRVRGHPHGDGALVFLFEDISAETALTRSFRSELQLSQAVIDTLDEAIVVFSAAGDLLISNASYATLWHVDPTATLGTLRILDAVRHWQSGALPNPIWGDIRDFVSELHERAEWFGDCAMKDGRQVQCRVVPLPGGATLVGFLAPGSRPPALPQQNLQPSPADIAA